MLFQSTKCTQTVLHDRASASYVQAPCRPAHSSSSVDPIVLVAPRRSIISCAKAKSGSGGKKSGGGQKSSVLAELLKKKAAIEQDAALEPGDCARPDQYRNPEISLLLFAVTQSYWKSTKKFLLEDVDLETLAEAVYCAPFALLVHDRFQPGVTDPHFTYANKGALQLWEANWDQLVGMHSRLSAPEDVNTQEDRNKLLNAAATSGLETGYSGWRQSLSGSKFKILDATLFNVRSTTGELQGQAAVFSEYELEDGTKMIIRGEEPPKRAIELPPSEEEIAAAQARVEEQAAVVRALKEGEGRGNQDPRVRLAVTELKDRRETVAALQKKVEDCLAAAAAAFDDEGAD